MAKSKKSIPQKRAVAKLRKVDPDLRISKPPVPDTVSQTLNDSKSLVPTKLSTATADTITS
jgi:hypothetical protein